MPFYEPSNRFTISHKTAITPGCQIQAQKRWCFSASNEQNVNFKPEIKGENGLQNDNDV